MSKIEQSISDMVSKCGKKTLRVNTKDPVDSRVVENFLFDNKIKRLYVTGKIDRKDFKPNFNFTLKYLKKVFTNFNKQLQFVDNLDKFIGTK